MINESIRSRMCDCGKKLLLKIGTEDGKIQEVALTTNWDQSTVAWMCDSSTRKSRKVRTGVMGRAYCYCKSCNRRDQIRTFSTLEEYL